MQKLCNSINTSEDTTHGARMLPKISIVMTTFNPGAFLPRALDSLAAQEYPNLEVIVADGASSDGTVALLQRRSDIVTRWLSEPDNGATEAANKGFDMCTGQIFGWLDCDERYLPGTLQLVGRTFAEEPSLDIVFGHRIVVDKDGNEIGRMKLPAMHPGKYALYASGLLFSDTTFWTADVHRRTGRLDEANYPRYGNDFDWFCRLGLKVRRWRRLDAWLSEFADHDGRVTKNVPQLPDIARDIRKRTQRLAGVGPLRVMLLSPYYFVLSRHGRFGWRGLLRPPSPVSLLRIAGLAR